MEGHIDEAARLGMRALDTVERTVSDRVRLKLREFYGQAGPYATDPDIAELRDRIKPVLADDA